MERDPEAGVTLVEVLVALGIGALIAIAGFTVLGNALATQSRSDGRLERMAEIERAMQILTLDLELIARPALDTEDGTVRFERAAFAAPGETVSITYALENEALLRRIGGAGAPRDQVLISAVRDIDWQGYAGGTWRDLIASDDPDLPRAVRALIDLAPIARGPAGQITRVVLLPRVSE